MGDVCNTIVKPRTKCIKRTGGGKQKTLDEVLADVDAKASPKADSDSDEDSSKCSYAELGIDRGLKDRRGQPAFGRATHFVSHAWRSDFGSFVDALDNWMRQNEVPEDGTYFWVDAFVVNQHQTQSYPQRWWSTRFMQAIAEIGNTVLVLDPWDNPVPLTRAWVLWEIYCTIITGARLHFTMRSVGQNDFKAALRDSFERVQTALSCVDVSKSEAFHMCDQSMIHNEIERTIGFTKMNELVQTRLIQWLVDAAKDTLMQMRSEKVELPDRLRLQENLAKMLRESGKNSEAEASLRKLLEEMEQELGADDVRTLGCLNQLAVTLQKSGKVPEALELHRDCISRRRQVLGDTHDETLQSASNLAVLLSQRKPLTDEQFAEARDLYKLAMEGREKSIGAGHPRTLYTVSNLAMLVSEAPSPSLELLAEAEALHSRAVESLTAALHETHPLTLTALHNQARHWLARAAFDGYADSSSGLLTQAAAQLRKVHVSRVEKLGKEHPDTLATEAVLMAERKRSRLQSGAAGREDRIAGYSTWKELSLEEISEMRTAEHFWEIRTLCRRYGVDRIREELTSTGWVDAETHQLTLGMQPFNVFARIASGTMPQLDMASEQARLGPFQSQFVVARNRPECDDMWASNDSAWVGKASMSKHHRFLTVRNLHWEWFNLLTFGLVSDRKAAVELLEQLQEAALLYTDATPGWPSRDHVGLFFHVYAHSSINSLHLHILDMQNLGPSHEKLSHRNLPLAAALLVLRREMQELID